MGSRGRLISVAVVAISAMFMANLDLWIVNVALVDMQRSLGGSLASLSWVLNAYAVTLAALLIPAGRLGDRIGHRRVFLAGIAVFTIASLICAVAPDVLVLVAARVVQAAGAAALVPTSLALLLAAVDTGRRMAATRGWSAAGALAAVAGPLLGGLLVDLSWRWVFVVNLPVGVLAWVLGRRALAHDRGRADEPMPDLLGSVLLVLGVGALTGALVEAPSWGWTSPPTVAVLAVAAAGIVVFVLRCRRHPAPLLELPLLRVRRFATANVATFLFSVSFGIMLLSNSLWCQDVWHYSAFRTGLAMAPGPAMVPIATALTARLVHRLGPAPVAALGCVLLAASQLWRVLVAGTEPEYVSDLLPSMLGSGAGVGLALGTLIAAGVTALPDGRSATGSAILNSGRQVGSALGVAVLVTLLGPAAGAVPGYLAAWTVGAVVAFGAALAGLAVGRNAARSPAVQRPGRVRSVIEPRGRAPRVRGTAFLAEGVSPAPRDPRA
jgi:EmrB/QacA subfamily drug resistance transporter